MPMWTMGGMMQMLGQMMEGMEHRQECPTPQRGVMK